MADNVTNELLLEHMKSLQAAVAGLRDSQARIERRLGAIEDLAGVLVRSASGTNTDVDDLRRRIDRIERRLELEPGE